jgi:hypothetical protein
LKSVQDPQDQVLHLIAHDNQTLPKRFKSTDSI